MEKYELTVILPEKATAARIKAFRSKLDGLMKNLKGQVTDEKDWGKMDFTYKIKNQESGVYMHYLLELSGNSVKKLDDALKLDEGILRHLLIKKDNDKKENTKK